MPPANFQRHCLTLQSNATASVEASAWGRALAERAGLSERRIYALDLCIVELVTNVVQHGYRDAPGEIRLQLDLAPERAVLTIHDRAPAFDPLCLPAPAKPASLDEATIGGYGVHMVRSAASGCRYERRDGWNVFTASFGEA